MTRQESFLKPDFSLELFIMQEEISLVDVRFLILKHNIRRIAEMTDKLNAERQNEKNTNKKGNKQTWKQ